MQQILPPLALEPGDTIGVFTPSSPAHLVNPGLFDNGVRNLEALGFRVRLGRVTAEGGSQGYRSAGPRERAAELMELVEAPDVRAVISTIGGTNSNSITPYLDFDRIREERVVVCGFSDVTSLHLAILKHAGLRTFYGPSVMCWFGEWPDGVPESTESFLDAVMRHRTGSREPKIPARWSNHRRSWENDDWRELPRQWKPQDGWRVLSRGFCEGPILACNLNTLVSSAGTPEWPDLRGRILLVEEMDCPMSRFERSLRQLERIGVFDEVAGLLVGKPEVPDAQGAPFDRDQLLAEVLGDRLGAFPIVTDVDCGHTVPMLTVPQELATRLTADEEGAGLEFLEPAVQPR